MNEIDLDQIQSLVRASHRKLASARAAQRLMLLKTARAPAVEERFSGQIGKGEPCLAIRAEEFESAAALRCEFLEWRE